MEVDQAAIDEILASAEADTPESRIDKLEKELDVLKGSVKKLLLDLRETLNNLENPFQNLQNLAEGALAMPQSAQPQQIQIIPAQIPEPQPEPEPEVEPEPEQPEVDETRKEEVEPEVGAEPAPAVERAVEERAVEDRRGEDRVEVEEVMKKEEGDTLQQVGVYERVEGPREEVIRSEAQVLTKYDIVTLFNLMEWVKGMLEKYTLDSLRLMLELFESAGYISEDAKDFVSKLAELIALNDGFEDMLFELYRLHKLMNPQDTSMDSKLLALILEKRL